MADHDDESAQHEHVFHRAELRHADGTAIPDGRRCPCGMEVVGNGPLALNAGIVRAGREFNRALGGGLASIADRIEADRRRRFPEPSTRPGLSR